MKTFDYKVVFLGDTSVGKSSIVTRFTRDEFFDFQEPTIGAAFQTQRIQLDDSIVRMEFWDTAGQERYRSLAPMYYRGAAAAFIVYDITNKESLDSAKYWLRQIKLKGEPRCVIALLGNKKDAIESRSIEREEGLDIAEQDGCIFFEVSAKNGHAIKDSIIAVATELAKNVKPQINKTDEFVIRPQQQKKLNLPKCCNS